MHAVSIFVLQVTYALIHVKHSIVVTVAPPCINIQAIASRTETSDLILISY